MITATANDATGPGHWKELTMTFEEALGKLPAALQKEGFGIITQIDIQDTLEKKLGVPFRRYRIVGACNPSFAHKALEADLRVGLLLPCNVVLYETDDGKGVLGFVDPKVTLGAMIRDDELAPLAEEVSGRLLRVLNEFA